MQKVLSGMGKIGHQYGRIHVTVKTAVFKFFIPVPDFV